MLEQIFSSNMSQKHNRISVSNPSPTTLRDSDLRLLSNSKQTGDWACVMGEGQQKLVCRMRFKLPSRRVRERSPGYLFHPREYHSVSIPMSALSDKGVSRYVLFCVVYSNHLNTPCLFLVGESHLLYTFNPTQTGGVKVTHGTTFGSGISTPVMV